MHFRYKTVLNLSLVTIQWDTMIFTIFERTPRPVNAYNINRATFELSLRVQSYLKRKTHRGELNIHNFILSCNLQQQSPQKLVKI